MRTDEKTYCAAFGLKLRSIRKQQKIRQQNLAAKIGVHRNTLMRWEREGMACSVWDLLKLAEALNVHPVALLRARVQP